MYLQTSSFWGKYQAPFKIINCKFDFKRESINVHKKFHTHYFSLDLASATDLTQNFHQVWQQRYRETSLFNLVKSNILDYVLIHYTCIISIMYCYMCCYSKKLLMGQNVTICYLPFKIHMEFSLILSIIACYIDR